MTLSEFLLARIAEDEAVGHQWERLEEEAARAHGVAEPTGWRSRLTLEVEAKRRIVELHDGMHRCPSRPDSPLLSDRPCDTLLFLALPYVGHPDYREEWRP